MIRSLVMIAAILTAGTAAAQLPVTVDGPNGMPMSPWPPGAGSGRGGDTATVSARATGAAVSSAPMYRGRLNVQRRGATREDAEAALEKVLTEARAIGGVELHTVRRDGSRTIMEPAQMQPSTPANPLPAIPQRGQMVQVHIDTATMEVESPVRRAILDWASRVPPPPQTNPNMPAFQPTPYITERIPDDDPAWAQATRNGLLAAERDARNAAAAAGGELGKLVGVWTERQAAYVVDGKALVMVTAEYQISRPRR